MFDVLICCMLCVVCCLLSIVCNMVVITSKGYGNTWWGDTSLKIPIERWSVDNRIPQDPDEKKET